MSVNNFEKQLVKGHIVENIFELMFRKHSAFDVLPLGYERVTPGLIQFNKLDHVKAILDNIRHLPDFALISKDKSEVHLVEVKYRSNPTDEKILEIAEKISSKYTSVFLFLATPHGFYFETCEKIKENFGKINELGWIEKEIQNNYLNLLKEFISNSLDIE